MAHLKITSTEMTLGAKSASVDIPKTRQGGHLFGGRNTFAAMPAKTVPVPVPSQMLPTPPNSISPSLPPQEFRARGHLITENPPTPLPLDFGDTLSGSDDRDRATTAQVLRDSDVGDGGNDGGDYFDAAGTITPALLARYHLPEVLLAHGPLAIRHLMGYLTTSVPGFSRIPPAKARRLVVGALEGRGHGGEGGGLSGDVEFEKVGWGRWDARIRGQPFGENRSQHPSSLSGAMFTPPESLPSFDATYSTKGFPFLSHAKGADGTRSGASWTDDSIVFSHDEDMEFMDQEDDMILDHEADKMSLDNDGSCSSSEAPEEDLPNIEDDGGDVTDEEDWANIGAAALRQAYLPKKRSGHRDPVIHGPPRKRVAGLATGVSARRKPPQDMAGYNKKNIIHPIAGLDIGSDSQERDAIEALVRLSNV
ncbi:MAG: DNA-binding proteins Bright/BRCAA1/RBP1 and proteins containing BRIGHT domain [Peltula sp. TS41687]|nr:MAG: DNA-binding proteins Bright/BRCAA1/RBP1 and proteins containing BRIGHT domain [Peltula sp. TS41687]